MKNESIGENVPQQPCKGSFPTRGAPRDTDYEGLVCAHDAKISAVMLCNVSLVVSLTSAKCGRDHKHAHAGEGLIVALSR